MTTLMLQSREVENAHRMGKRVVLVAGMPKCSGLEAERKTQRIAALHISISRLRRTLEARRDLLAKRRVEEKKGLW